jgi:hypothetical protein
MNDVEKKLVDHLAARGVVVAPDGTFVRAPGPQSSEGLSDDQLREMNESGARGPYQGEAQRKYRWVLHLWDVVQVLARDAEPPQWSLVTVFWLRLHGVLAPLRESQHKFFDIVQVDPSTYVPNRGSLLDLALETYHAIEALRACFTQDELIYVAHRRHLECHPTGNPYAVGWGARDVRVPTGAALDEYLVSTVGAQFTAEQLEAAVRRVIVAHKNEWVHAVASARKVHDPVANLVMAMRKGV